jgi:hypothetical protein
MGYPAALQRKRTFCTERALIFCSVIFLISTGASQTAQSNKPRATPEVEILNKYPGLVPEAGRLVEKLQRDVELPRERNHSELLPLLPASTTAYMAFPNYGEAAHQTLTIFRRGLNESPDLRAWWTSGNMRTAGPKIEDAVERFSQVSEYIGDEIVVSGAFAGHDPDLMVMAAVRKSGLKAELQKTVLALADKSKPNVRILDERELATVKEISPQELVVVVRPDFVFASPNLASCARSMTAWTGALATLFPMRLHSASCSRMRAASASSEPLIFRRL